MISFEIKDMTLLLQNISQTFIPPIKTEEE
jgi:hypothetical protein